VVAFDYGQAMNSNDSSVKASTIVPSLKGGVALDNYTVWRLGAIHKFSKRTRVYLAYSNTDGDDSGVGESEILSVGMRHNF